MFKKIIAISLLTLTGCSALEMTPPSHGTPDAVFTSETSPKYVAVCLSSQWHNYDPMMPYAFEEKYWGYRAFNNMPNGESADVYTKNGRSVINYYAPKTNNKEWIAASEKATKFCLTANYHAAPQEKRADGQVKLW
ncbi:hypothetical protein [Pseudomonas graminis]